MSAVSWPAGVNTDAYGVETGYIDNAKKSEYDSGRVMQYQKNTAVKRKYSVSFRMTKSEYKLFDTWYKNTLGGNAGSFTFPSFDLDGTMKEYNMTAPTATGQRYKYVQTEFTEV